MTVPMTVAIVTGWRQTGDPSLSVMGTALMWISGTPLVVTLVGIVVGVFRVSKPASMITSVGVRSGRLTRTWDQLAVAGHCRWLPDPNRPPQPFLFADWDIDLRYAGWLIAYYLAHPQQRSAIGQAAEGERLEALFANTPPAGLAESLG